VIPEPSRSLAFIIGTRAQLIKVAPVVRACERIGLSCSLVMTGQHKDTMEDLLGEFGIRSPRVSPPEIVERSTITSLLWWIPQAYRSVRAGLRQVARSAGVSHVLVHGDTLSTLIGAYAGRRHGARVVHLESGLTSGRLFNPFPEELVRRLVFRMTDVAICPNSDAVARMQRIRGVVVFDSGGNTILDAVELSGAVAKVGTSGRPYVVASLHRFQNLYDARRLQELVSAIVAIAGMIPVHFILHPATRLRLERAGLEKTLEAAPGVQLLPRMGYGDFLRLAAAAACVLTDGGSNQEELAALGVPTIVMRPYTERPDGIGANAMMEAEVPGGVVDFVRARAFDALRAAPLVHAEPGPSARIAHYLAENSGARDPE
jgi:UDP-N-acetylglucosamine 2-epimerase (non-hydrolysing)